MKSDAAYVLPGDASGCRDTHGHSIGIAGQMFWLGILGLQRPDDCTEKNRLASTCESLLIAFSRRRHHTSRSSKEDILSLRHQIVDALLLWRKSYVLVHAFQPSPLLSSIS